MPKPPPSPGVGRALSVATGEGAEALANAARAGGQVYRANIPIALIKTLEKAGLVRESVTQMGGVTAREYRFLPEAAELFHASLNNNYEMVLHSV
jgi:hypothetical protein